MQETHSNCFRLKKCSTTLRQAKTDNTFRHSCLPVFTWRRIVLHFFDPKQLLRVSCILWCYFLKWYSTMLQNASLWCSIFVRFQVLNRNIKMLLSINNLFFVHVKINGISFIVLQAINETRRFFIKIVKRLIIIGIDKSKCIRKCYFALKC